jgi:DNA repair exonuclease SbcCD ATPase subunit
MSITLDEISVEGFLSVGPRQQLKLGGQGLVLVEGDNRMARKARSNGSGKSGFIEAPVWCLVGKTLRGVSADDVVNRTLGKGCLVELAGKKDGVPFEVRRGRRVQGKNPFSFRFDGKDLTAQGDPRETQRQIKLYLGLGADLDVLANTLVFDGQDPKWRFTSLHDAEQKKLLEKILGVQNMAEALVLVKEMERQSAARLASIDGIVTGCESTVRTLKATMKGQRRDRVRELRGELKRAKAELAQRSSDVDAMRSGVDMPRHERAVAKWTAEAERLQARVAGITERLSVLGATRQAYNREAERLVKQYRTSEDSKTRSQCAVCGSAIERSKMKAHLAKLWGEYKEAEAQVKQADNDLASLERDREEALSRQKITQTALRQNQKRLEEAEERAREAQRADNQLDSLRERVTMLRSQLQRAKNGEGVAQERIRRDIESHKARLAKYQAKREAEDVKRRHYQFWCEGFGNSGIKSLYLDYVVPIMNQRAQVYADLLADGLQVSFDSESQTKKGQARDKFRVIVENEQGAGSYEGDSGGEKRKADIVVARVLQSLQADRAGTRFDVAWYDEVFESLDETSAESVIGMLMDDAKQYSSLFVVSHQSWLKEYFPRVLTMVKDGGYTHWEWT